MGDNVTDTPTRDRLITEARRLFATRGFRGASVRDITSAARANLGAITYHFGSKRALYDAVLESTLAELVMGVEDAAAQPGTSAERLRDICRTLFGFFREHPATPRLILHELAGRAGLPPAIVPFIRRNLAAVRGVVEQGQARGEFRTADPTLITFSLMSQVIWFAIIGREVVPVVDQATDPASFATRVEQHVADVVTRFLLLEGHPA